MCCNKLVTCFCIGIWKILAWERWICRRLWSFPCFISKFRGRWLIHQYRFPTAVNSGISSFRLSFYSPLDWYSKNAMLTFYWSSFCLSTLSYITVKIVVQERKILMNFCYCVHVVLTLILCPLYIKKIYVKRIENCEFFISLSTCCLYLVQACSLLKLIYLKPEINISSDDCFLFSFLTFLVFLWTKYTKSHLLWKSCPALFQSTHCRWNFLIFFWNVRSYVTYIHHPYR